MPAGPIAIGLVVLVAALTALFAGAVLGLGARLLLAPVLALGGALAVMVAPAPLVVWLLLVVSMFVVGPAIYFANVEMMRWLAPAIAASLTLPWVMRALSPRHSPVDRTPQAGVLRWYFLFLVVLAFGTVLSEPRAAEMVFASRMYLMYLPLALVLSAGLVQPDAQWRMWRFLLWASIAQAPVALYQALVVAPRRSFQQATWDAVVGTFPGNPEIGGANAGMSIFCLIVAFVALALRRQRLIGRGMLVLVVGSALTTIAVGEVKAVVLMIPAALGVFYLPELARRPLRTLSWMLVGVVLAVGFIAAYNSFYYSEHSAWSRDKAPASAQESIANQFDPDLQQRGYIMGRVASFYDWGRRNLRSDQLPYGVIGHGAGALQFGRIGIGEIAQRLSYRADNTATGLLLWEAGVVGHVLIVLFMGSAAIVAFRLRNAHGLPPVHRAICYALCTGFALHILCLPYKDFMFRAAPSQAFLFFAIGYVAYWSRIAHAAARTGLERR